MSLKYWSAVVLLVAAPLVHAESSDPVYGEDAQVKAVLACHADYARRYAAAATSLRATVTEVATAAQAACAGQMEALLKSRITDGSKESQVTAKKAPGRFEEHHRQRMGDYAFAYTIDASLKASAPF